MPKDDKPVKKARAKRQKKDPNAPKRYLSAYMHFANENRDTIRQENPEASFGQIGKLLGQKWNSLSAEEKAPYEDKAGVDKKRYEEEMAVWKSRPNAASKEDEE